MGIKEIKARVYPMLDDLEKVSLCDTPSDTRLLLLESVLAKGHQLLSELREQESIS